MSSTGYQQLTDVLNSLLSVTGMFTTVFQRECKRYCCWYLQRRSGVPAAFAQIEKKPQQLGSPHYLHAPPPPELRRLWQHGTSGPASNTRSSSSRHTGSNSSSRQGEMPSTSSCSYTDSRRQAQEDNSDQIYSWRWKRKCKEDVSSGEHIVKFEVGSSSIELQCNSTTESSIEIVPKTRTNDRKCRQEDDYVFLRKQELDSGYILGHKQTNEHRKRGQHSICFDGYNWKSHESLDDAYTRWKQKQEFHEIYEHKAMQKHPGKHRNMFQGPYSWLHILYVGNFNIYKTLHLHKLATKCRCEFAHAEK